MEIPRSPPFAPLDRARGRQGEADRRPHPVEAVYLKWRNVYRAWGETAKGEEAWDKAMDNVEMYRILDQVCPPNYYRMSYIYYSRGD